MPIVPTDTFKGGAKIRPVNLGKRFLPFQERWIMDSSPFKIMQKSRQIGISWSTAYRAVRECISKKSNYDFWVSSRDEMQAKLFLEDCKNFAGILGKASKDLGQVIYKDEQRTSAYVLQFENGKRINSMSSNADAQAGKRGSRILDEFALHKDPKKLLDIASPGTDWGGSIEIVSTHRGSHNFFNKLVEEAKYINRRKASLHTVTLENALDQGFLYKLQSKIGESSPVFHYDEADYFNYIRNRCSDEETFQQEYMCVPADDESAFISYDLISKCEYSLDEKWEKTLEELAELGEILYLGVDVGRKSDLTTLYLFAKVNGVYYTRKIIRLKDMPFSKQEAILYRLLSMSWVFRCCIDATGLGMQFAERAKEKFGSSKVEAVTFTNKVKEDLAYTLKAAFEDGILRIPRDKDLTASLRAVKKTTTSAGNIRFDAARTDAGHADEFWAMGLALHAGKTQGHSAISPVGLEFNIRREIW